MPTCNCFLLTHSFRDKGRHFEITLYAKSTSGQTVRIIIDNFMPSFFVPRSTPMPATRLAAVRKQLPLKDMRNAPLDCLYFASYADLVQSAKNLRRDNIIPLESDIHPVERFLMERMVRGGMLIEGKCSTAGPFLEFKNPMVRGADADVSLEVMSVDIETNADTDQVYSIAACGKGDAVFIIGNGPGDEKIKFCSDETELLRRFMAYVAEQDPDIIIGWNVVDFDLAILQKRCLACNVQFAPGRGDGARILPPSSAGKKHTARIPGRVVMDVPVMLRAYYRTFEEYSLDYVASEMLGQHKTITRTGRAKIDEINRLFREDKSALARYNLSDAVLTRDIFIKAGILPNAIERAKRSGHTLDRSGGSVAAFDYLYLPRMHRQGYAAGDVVDIALPTSPLPGGYVMESKPGIYENVLLLDFKSLYPTIIMTFRIDPLGAVIESPDRIRGPAGPAFARDKAILPEIIAELMQARADAKRTNNAALSQSIKILMNSFYGVLGSTGCRFFSADIASAITGIGRYILKTTCTYIENATGCEIIYGDTDSLFVLLGPNRQHDAVSAGRDIVVRANAWLSSHMRDNFSAESALDLEFETHFRYFFMPTIRGSTQGSKKRYCGAIEKNNELSLVFKGLESARTDWTELARQFQRDLYMRIFSGMPVEAYIIKLVDDMKSGKLDKMLVYRKGVRKQLDQYTDHVPPHIQAARMLPGSPPSRIAYAITVDGPQPMETLSSPLDYGHYIDTQIRPIADAILEWKQLSFDAIISGQQDLFKGQ